MKIVPFKPNFYRLICFTGSFNLIASFSVDVDSRTLTTQTWKMIVFLIVISWKVWPSLIGKLICLSKVIAF